LGAHEVPDEFRGRIDDYVDLVIHEMLPRVAEDKLAEYCDVFCEPDVFPVEQARTVLQAAQALGLGCAVHADQFSADYGSLLAAELHAATADHLESSTPAAMAALRTAGVQPVLLPASVYSLGSTRYPAARRMIDLGLPVVLATDFNPGSSPTAFDADGALARRHADEDDGGRIDHGGHHQCRVQPPPGRPDRLAGMRQSGRFRHPRLRRLRELPYFFGAIRRLAVYRAGRRVLYTGSR
jgi:hypothetical protein